MVATTVQYSPNQEEALGGPKLCQGSLLSVVFGPDDSAGFKNWLMARDSDDEWFNRFSDLYF